MATDSIPADPQEAEIFALAQRRQTRHWRTTPHSTPTYIVGGSGGRIPADEVLQALRAAERDADNMRVLLRQSIPAGFFTPELLETFKNMATDQMQSFPAGDDGRWLWGTIKAMVECVEKISAVVHTPAPADA